MTTMYTQDHEWINIEDHEAATVGITHHAQDALGDVVFVDLPAVGTTFKKGCLLYTSPSPRDGLLSRMPSSA